MTRPIAVTVVQGLPGAGRSALIEHLAEQRGASLCVAPSLSTLTGALCAGHSAAVVELGGHVSPSHALHAFVAHGDHAPVVPPAVAQLDTRVTVVDAARIAHQIVDGGTAVDGGARTVAEVAVAQVEQADVIILNRCDQASPEALERARALVTTLNPTAGVQEAICGRVAPEAVLGTGTFSLDVEARVPGWLSAVRRWDADARLDPMDVSQVGPVQVLVYRAWRPFHPARLREALTAPRDGLVRVRGWLWLANVPERVMAVSGAGPAVELRPLGRWWATRHPIYWPAQGPQREALDRRWREPWGDRRQEIVWVGVDIDPTGVQKALDESLLPDADMSAGLVRWQNLEQVFVPLPWRHVSATR